MPQQASPVSAPRLPVATLLVALIFAGGLLRACGIFDDFWLDEIWSWKIATTLHRPLDVLLAPAAWWDNNHPLNTLWLWLLGPDADWRCDRLAALSCGIAMLVIIPRMFDRQKSAERIIATLLLAASYPLTFYASEARGYSLAALCALAALGLARAAFRRLTILNAAGFGICVMLGLLSHLSFIHVYAGLLVCSCLRFTRAPRRPAALFALHVTPMAFLLWYAAVFIRHVQIGGAPPAPLWSSLSAAVAGLAGWTGGDGSNLIVAIGAVGGFLVLLRAMARRGDDAWVLLMVAVFVGPAVQVIYLASRLDHPQPMATRYFLVSLPLIFVCAAPVLAGRLSRGSRVIAALLAAFVILNVSQTLLFLHGTRGHYADAVRYLVQNSPGNSPISVLSDHPLRTGIVLRYYQRVALNKPDEPGERLIDPIELNDKPDFSQAIPPPWLMVGSDQRGQVFARPVDVGVGVNYRFEREFSYYGLSGYCWDLFRRVDRKPTVPPPASVPTASR